MPVKAVFPGTFDPFTNGHRDLVARASRVFSEVVVAVTDNRAKRILLDIEERLEIAQVTCNGISGVSVMAFSGLLIDFARAQHASVIVRGLRAVSDFEYEFQLAAMNRNLAPDVETVFLTPAEQFSFLSSTLIKDVVKLGGDASSYLHPRAIDLLRSRL
jgi:pantetheine-phosphate adenylyltransferase